jgi:SAM-dependent methyltransferase
MDYLLQDWRGRVAAKYICQDDVLLDVGCYDGLFLAKVQKKVSYAVGLEKILPQEIVSQASGRLIISDITAGLPFSNGYFDAVSLLAVFEHLQNKTLVINELSRILRPGGRVVLTVPGDQVDRVLDWLIAMGIADGMSLDEHHGYQAKDTPALFKDYGFTLLNWQRFQFGLNNLFVFKKYSTNEFSN